MPSKDVWAYASGEGVNSISMNGISNFAMLFYTQILGMNPALVGTALAIATIWDAVTDPAMGTISDRTKSRFGRRHPYMLLGGLALALSFFAFWYIPEVVRGEKVLFTYLIIINLFMRTAFTVFFVPYTALGFEMCRTANDRSRIQGVRYGFNMIINMIFGAFAWVLFFRDGRDEQGRRVDGTLIEQNFINMGTVLTLSIVALVFLCVYSTFKFADRTPPKKLSVEMPPTADAKAAYANSGGGVMGALKAFFTDVKDVMTDRLVWFVFGFFGLAQFAMLIVSQVQMFTYVHYMEFTDAQKTFVHSGGMFAFMTGSFLLGSLVRRFDKKLTGYFAMAISSAGGLGLLLVFTGGLVEPRVEGGGFPPSVLIFGFFQMLWWGGCGILLPLAISMVADLSEVKKWKTGQVTEGRYAAGLSFFLKAAKALGLLLTGYILTGVGFDSTAEQQSLETINRLALITFITGPILMVFSFFILRFYPVTKDVLDSLRMEYGHFKDDA